MAKINTVFGFVDNITNPLKKMNNVLNSTKNAFSRVQGAIITANSVMNLVSTSVNIIKKGYASINNEIQKNIQVYQYQAEQELKLETIMKQRMNATKGDIQAIKDLASAQQKLGIYGDEMILQGAQELSMFVSNRKSIENLIPAMNNLIAQQKGYKATAQDFDTIAKTIGKTLNGNTSALLRMGIVLSDAEKEMISYGNEEQRTLALAKIITSKVGDMNQVLAKTDAGQIQNVTNRLGDLRENIGKTLMPLQSAMARIKNSFSGDFLVTINNVLKKIIPVLVSILDSVNKVYQGIKNILNKIKGGINTFIQDTIKNINSLAVALGIIGTAITAFGAIWIATHAKMLAITIATNAKILASWIATNAKMLATHLATMIKMAVQWFIGLGPVGWIITGVIALIIGLIVVCVKLGATFEKIGRVIGKVFGAIYAVGYNYIMGLINLFIKLQNIIADSIIGEKLGMQKWELKEYKNIQETMNAGAEKGGSIGKGMDDWIKGLGDKLNKNNISESISEAFNFSGSGAIEVTDKNLIDIADDYKELLSKRATERFNLQYRQVTPSVNIDHMDIHQEADSDKVISRLSSGLREFASSDLRGFA